MLNEKTRKLLGIGVIAATAILAVAGYFILPETLVMQVSAGGQPSTTMPKLIGLLIPIGISAVFGVLFVKDGNTKCGIGAGAGLLAMVLIFIFNI